ncbi:MAG: RnfABCDGE type electron transport complex subunit D [Candidatus Liptonbacteria bacterium]|nr:RnfABCDGE type electron transport complex subunit D [Candidatus Liptonbacteria bacterium]
MLSLIDNFLNRITMYRLVLYYLVFLLAAAVVFGFFGILPYSPLTIIFSTLVLVFVSWVTNELFSRVFGAQPNVESVYITALILALIIDPVAPSEIAKISFLIWAAVWAMASKYILAGNRKHLFNPAAFAVALTAITINQSASWWAGGNLPLMLFIVLGGFLVARKVQRFHLIFAFLAAGLAMTVLTGDLNNPFSTLEKALLHAPFFFFAFVMLTEPLTTPPTRALRIIYGAVVGLLFAPAIHLGTIYSTPELSLLAGNIFSYLVSHKKKYVLSLSKKELAGEGIYDFVFHAGDKVQFRAGQYMEWTLGQDKPDSRGNRRCFTIASSPTEDEIRIGVKFYDNPSTFKSKMLSLEPGDKIVMGQLAGDFTLPSNPGEKLAFLAGGIGVTPFRSMAKYLSDKNEKRDIVLLYSNKTLSEIAYKEVFDEAAAKTGMRTVYVLTSTGEIPAGINARAGMINPAPFREASTQHKELVRDLSTLQARQRYIWEKCGINAEMLKMEIPDYMERTFYVSGPHSMVAAMEKALREIGIKRSRIKIDFFPGFA